MLRPCRTTPCIVTRTPSCIIPQARNDHCCDHHFVPSISASQAPRASILGRQSKPANGKEKRGSSHGRRSQIRSYTIPQNYRTQLPATYLHPTAVTVTVTVINAPTGQNVPGRYYHRKRKTIIIRTDKEDFQE